MGLDGSCLGNCHYATHSKENVLSHLKGRDHATGQHSGHARWFHMLDFSGVFLWIPFFLPPASNGWGCFEQEKKREAAQGLGPGGVHVLKEEEEKNGIFAGDGTNGFLTCRIFFPAGCGVWMCLGASTNCHLFDFIDFFNLNQSRETYIKIPSL